MASIKHFTKFVLIAEKWIKSDLPEKFGHGVRAVIDDIIFDVSEENKIVTERIYEVAKNSLNCDKKIAKLICDEFAVWLSKNPKLLKESKEELDMVLEAKGRVQTLRGRDKKKREAKAKVMKKLNADPAFKAAKDKVLAVAQRLAKKYASEMGITPSLINVDKVTVRK